MLSGHGAVLDKRMAEKESTEKPVYTLPIPSARLYIFQSFAYHDQVVEYLLNCNERPLNLKTAKMLCYE